MDDRPARFRLRPRSRGRSCWRPAGGKRGGCAICVAWELDPREFDVPRTSADQLAGGTPRENAAIITGVLRGEGNPGATAAVVLNAAAAIYVSGRVDGFADAVRYAREALTSGAGLAALERLRAASPRLPS